MGYVRIPNQRLWWNENRSSCYEHVSDNTICEEGWGKFIEWKCMRDIFGKPENIRENIKWGNLGLKLIPEFFVNNKTDGSLKC